MKKIFAAAVLCLINLQADAAIAVVDIQNIAQTAKVYAETVKTVANTAEQIKLQTQELLSMPTDILNQYTSAYTSTINGITNTMSNAAYNMSTGVITESIDNYWNNKFSTIGEDTINATVMREDGIKRRNQTTEDNKKTSEAYVYFQKELQNQQNRLKDLLEQNKKAVGQKQSQQIANQIAAVRANISAISSNLQILNNKRELEKQENEIVKEKNIINLQNATAKATEQYIEKLNTSSKEKITDDKFIRTLRR